MFVELGFGGGSLANRFNHYREGHRTQNKSRFSNSFAISNSGISQMAQSKSFSAAKGPLLSQPPVSPSDGGASCQGHRN